MPIITPIGSSAPKKRSNTDRSTRTCHAVKATATMTVARNGPIPVHSSLDVTAST